MVTSENSVVSMSNAKKFLVFGLVVVVVVLGLFGWRAWKLGKMSTREWPELQGGVYSQPVTKGGVKYLVPPDEIYEDGLGKDGYPRLMDPAMVDVTTADDKMIDDVSGIALDVDGTHAFYSFQILNWHEVVHDEINGKSLLITYSPLTGSAVVYEPTVDGEERRFGDSGKLYNNATLLYDESSNTLWNQTSGQAIAGDDLGKKLTVYPSLVMRWDTWKAAYPNGQALSTDTGFARDYGRHPYGGYETAPGIFFPVNYLVEGLPLKERVYRLDHGEDVGIFVEKYLAFQKGPNLTLGEGEDALHAVAFMDYDTFTTRVFNSTVDGQVLTFIRDGKTGIKDKETGTSWSLEGVATRGALVGKRLTLLPTSRHYAFAHYAMFPDTVMSGQELFETDKKTEGGVEGNVINLDGNGTE